MCTITTGVDLAKSAFSAPGMDRFGRALRQHGLRREPSGRWLAPLPPARWSRWGLAIGARLGAALRGSRPAATYHRRPVRHTFRKGSKTRNDRADAEAIATTARQAGQHAFCASQSDRPTGADDLAPEGLGACGESAPYKTLWRKQICDQSKREGMPVDDVRGRIEVNEYVAGSSFRDEHFQREVDARGWLRQHKRSAGFRTAENYQCGRRHDETGRKRFRLLVNGDKDLDLVVGERRDQALHGLGEWIRALDRNDACVYGA